MKTAKEIFNEAWQSMPAYGDDNARVLYEFLAIDAFEECANQFKQNKTLVQFSIAENDFISNEEFIYFNDNRPVIEWPFANLPSVGDQVDVNALVDEAILSAGPKGDKTGLFGLLFHVEYIHWTMIDGKPIVEMMVIGE